MVFDDFQGDTIAVLLGDQTWNPEDLIIWMIHNFSELHHLPTFPPSWAHIIYICGTLPYNLSAFVSVCTI